MDREKFLSQILWRTRRENFTLFRFRLQNRAIERKRYFTVRFDRIIFLNSTKKENISLFFFLLLSRLSHSFLINARYTNSWFIRALFFSFSLTFAFSHNTTRSFNDRLSHDWKYLVEVLHCINLPSDLYMNTYTYNVIIS